MLFLAGADGAWRRIGRYGMIDGGRTMRITYDRGGRKLWNRQQVGSRPAPSRSASTGGEASAGADPAEPS